MGSDHHLLIAEMKMRICVVKRNEEALRRKKFNVQMQKEIDIKAEWIARLEQIKTKSQNSRGSIDCRWKEIKGNIQEAAK